ncbi:MAG: dicarboxylate/amino acid:cation symporter [Verrucomicrobia bacterium]|nr:dicarboxylate/amino acid:cation symporter [Verrucomicrobiota bacterium]
MENGPKSSDRIAKRILWGLVIGLVAGIVVRLLGGLNPSILSGAEWLSANFLDPFGQVFLRLLFFVVIPLVFASLALGVVQLGRLEKLGPLAGRTFLIFFFNMTIAVMLGLAMMNVLKPGGKLDITKKEEILKQPGFEARAQDLQTTAAAQPSFNLIQLVDMMMPRNLLRAVVDFQVLPLILFAILLGAAGTQLDPDNRQRMQTGLEILTQLMTRIVHFALLLAPFAVPALIFSVVVTFGFAFLKSLALFVAGVLVIVAIHLFGTMSLLLKLLTRRSPVQFFRAIRTILVTAFSTSSSSATLPTSIQVSREELGVSASTAGFVLPMGATMNMSGTALYEGCVVLFIAQVYGVDLSLGQQTLLLLFSVMSAVAVAGIPGGSLPLIVGLLVNFGIPAEGIALILGTDRILDMARTVLNVAADVVTACIVDEQLNPGATLKTADELL